MENGKGKSSKHFVCDFKRFVLYKKRNEDITRATVIYK